MTLEEKQAKEALDSIIKKSRVHLYKPIQIIGFSKFRYLPQSI